MGGPRGVWQQGVGANPLSPVGSDLRPPWIRLVLAHPTDVRSDWDLGNLEAR